MSVARYKSYFKTMTSDRLQTKATPSGGLVFACVEGLDIAGLLVVFKERYWDGLQWQVDMVFVDPGRRRCGIATELYDFAVHTLGPLRLSTERTNDGIAWCRAIEVRR